VRRIEPAYPDLFPITHVVRPGYLPGPAVALDPIRMGIVWEDAPRRILPKEISVPRDPVRAIAFARVLRERPEVLPRLLERGSSLLLVLDDPTIRPTHVGIRRLRDDLRVTVLVPVLPHPLSEEMKLPTAWQKARWGAVLGLFPFPGAGKRLGKRIRQLKKAGATFAVAAPLLLTPTDRHRILDSCESTDIVDRLENSLFHADVSRGLHALERRAGVALDRARMDSFLPSLVPHGYHPNAVRTAARLRLWARRLDQSHEESSWGWRLRRAATALDRLPNDPVDLASEGNLRVIPGFDPWVEEFTRALWNGGDPVEQAWRKWSGLDGGKSQQDQK
jgi:hypothetical protein